MTPFLKSLYKKIRTREFRIATQSFVFGQLGTQIIQALSGLIVVWFMPKNEFGFYTIFFTSVYTSSVLFGSPLGPAVISSIGKQSDDPEKLGRYISSAWSLRSLIMLISSPVGMASVIYFGDKNSVNPARLAIFVLLVPIGALALAKIDIFTIPLTLRKRFSDIYRIRAFALTLNVIVVTILWQSGVLTALTAAIGYIGTSYLHGRILKSRSQLCMVNPDRDLSEEKQQLKKILLPQIPNAIFGSIQGQLSIIVAMIFGSVSSVAAIGALGRLSQLFAFATALNQMVIGPLLARSGSRFQTNYRTVIGAAFMASSCMAISGAFFPEFFVSILGGGFENLAGIVWLVTLNAALRYFESVQQTVRSFRGWFAWWASWLFIGAIILAQILIAKSCDLSTIEGALLLVTAATCVRIVILFVFPAIARHRKHWFPHSTENSENLYRL